MMLQTMMDPVPLCPGGEVTGTPPEVWLIIAPAAMMAEWGFNTSPPELIVMVDRSDVIVAPWITTGPLADMLIDPSARICMPGRTWMRPPLDEKNRSPLVAVMLTPINTPPP